MTFREYLLQTINESIKNSKIYYYSNISLQNVGLRKNILINFEIGKDSPYLSLEEIRLYLPDEHWIHDSRIITSASKPFKLIYSKTSSKKYVLWFFKGKYEGPFGSVISGNLNQIGTEGSNGVFAGGIYESGVFYNCLFLKGIFKSGYFIESTFKNGFFGTELSRKLNIVIWENSKYHNKELKNNKALINYLLYKK